jgi:hypothetical protein
LLRASYQLTAISHCLALSNQSNQQEAVSGQGPLKGQRSALSERQTAKGLGRPRRAGQLTDGGPAG